MFANYKEAMKLEKYGKQQQELILQMVFWKNLKMKEGVFFHKFRNQQKSNEPFYFAPFVAETSKPIEQLKVWKTHFKIKGRSELTPSEIEYHHK